MRTLIAEELCCNTSGGYATILLYVVVSEGNSAFSHYILTYKDANDGMGGRRGKPMKTPGLLVRFPGYPFHPEALLPDRRLAELAACLVEAGQPCFICDYGTPRLIGRLVPAAERESILNVVDHFLARRGGNAIQVLQTLWRVHALDRAYQRQRACVCREAGRELCRGGHWGFLVFSVGVRDDLEAVAAISREVRRHRPDLPLVAAGAFAERYAGGVLEACPVLDGVLVGPAGPSVAAWAEVVGDRSRWAHIPNLVHRLGNETRRTRRENVESAVAPMPAYDGEVYPALQETGAKIRLFELEDSYASAHSGPAWGPFGGAPRARPKSTHRIGEEIRYLMAAFGARVFCFAPSEGQGGHVGAIALSILRNGLDISYSRNDYMDPASVGMFPLLHASGCEAILFQVDTGSQRLLEDYYGRRMKVSQMEEVLRESQSAGLFTVVRLTYPCPADDFHTREETLRLIRRTHPDGALVEMPEAVPGSAQDEVLRRSRLGTALGLRRRNKFPQPTRFPFPFNGWRLPQHAVGFLSPCQAVQAQQTLLTAIEEQGVASLVSERLALMARVTEPTGDPREFAATTLRAFLSGNAEAIARFVDAFNRAACAPPAATPHRAWLKTARRWFPYDPLEEAVGN